MNMFSKKPKSHARKTSAAAAAAAAADPTAAAAPTDGRPQLQDLLKQRDFTGAVTLLEFQSQTPNEHNQLTQPWLAYSAYHLGDYQKALNCYQLLLQQAANADSSVEHPIDLPFYHLYIACCQYYLGNYQEAVEAALLFSQTPSTTKGQNTQQPYHNALQVRILFHCAQKLDDEKKLTKYHSLLQATNLQDQLSLASMHYQRHFYQEATEIYKQLLLKNRTYLALQVYVALCYYKLDYYDVSLEILQPYITAFPDSPIAINLRACNHYKLYDGRTAENELKVILELLSTTAHNMESDLIQHNLVVFRSGENALSVLPNVLDSIPEARLNLIIYYLKHQEVQPAFDLIKDIEPTTPHEYILKAICYTMLGQQQNNAEYVQHAQQLYQLVGASTSECDTIPGRQSMASCFFLLKQFEDVIIYLNSVKEYSKNDLSFLYNYGVTLASNHQWLEAEEVMLQIYHNTENNANASYMSDIAYLSWLCRILIMTGKPRHAWEIYLKCDNRDESFELLQIVANDCYRTGQFYYAAKAFDVLERLDGGNEYWDGKRGSICGVLQMVCAGKENKNTIRDCMKMLQTNAGQCTLLSKLHSLRTRSHKHKALIKLHIRINRRVGTEYCVVHARATPQAEFISRILQKFAMENGIHAVQV